MLVTAAVAFLVAGARALQATLPGFRLLNPVLGLCFAAAGLVALWAALGNARPLWRCPTVFVFAALLGACFAIAAGAHTAGWVYIMLIMLFYSAALLGSLLVIRSCGFRLGAGSLPFAQPLSGCGNV